MGNKIVKPYSLSEEAINKVKEIKEIKKYKSESAALEAIILGKETDDERIRKIVIQVLKEIQITATSDNDLNLEEKIQDEVETNIVASIEDIYNNIE